MPEAPADERRHRARGRGLSREVIVEAALALIDASGLGALSMRSLAHELDVEAMSLYRYVHGREDLLEGVVARLMAGLTADPDDEVAEHWQGFLQTVAHNVRRMALRHPRAFPLTATRHPAAPWLRPPLRSVEVVDAFLAALIDRGFTDAQAVGTYRSFCSFLLGQLLLESASEGVATTPDAQLDEGGADIPEGDASLDLRRAPNVLRLRSLLSEDHGEEEFEVSLEALIDRMESGLSR